MNIALFGHGKMGKIVEQIALKRGHDIAQIFNSQTTEFDLTNVDVAIDFSRHSSVVNNIKLCFNKNIPIVSGTTGWIDEYSEIVELCKIQNGSFLYASNFSLGVHIFFALNQRLAQMMNTLEDYALKIEETHHTQKIDAPSGTAISLANDIIANSSYEKWSLNPVEKNEIPITSFRKDDIPGTHVVSYDSAIDTIAIKHTAHTREGFALGAVIAAEFIVGKKGVFTMKDVLNIG